MLLTPRLRTEAACDEPPVPEPCASSSLGSGSRPRLGRARDDCLHRCGRSVRALCRPVSTGRDFRLPFSPPSREHLLGLDFAGRDVLSRFLWGGTTAILVALAGTLVGFAIGCVVGLVSAYRRGWVDEVLGRGTDLALAFPGLVLSLLLLAAFGTSLALIVIAIAVTTAPGVARIARAAALEIVDLPYVEAARARGEHASYVLAVEIFPGIRAPLLVDFGLRLTAAILLVAALSFVGLGLQPPAADWGLMIGENRIGLTVQPWPVVVPRRRSRS